MLVNNLITKIEHRRLAIAREIEELRAKENELLSRLRLIYFVENWPVP